MARRDFIRGLQAKPYRTRVKIFWLTVLLAAVLLVAVWILLVSLINRSNTANEKSSGGGLFGYVAEEFNKARERIFTFSDSKPQGAESDIAQAVEINMKSFTTDPDTQILTVYFEVKNNSPEILNFVETGAKNFQLNDGTATRPARAVLTTKYESFPKRILGNTTAVGQIVFSHPENKSFKLEISQLYFLDKPEEKFSKSLAFDLDLNKLKELQGVKLPRE